jgi:hypothetical protein
MWTICSRQNHIQLLVDNQFLIRGSLVDDIKISTVVYNNLVTNKTLLSAKCSLMLCIPPLSCSWYTDLDYGLYHVPALGLGLTADVTGELTPLSTSSHHDKYIHRSVYAHSLIFIFYRTHEIDDCSLFVSFHLEKKRKKKKKQGDI